MAQGGSELELTASQLELDQRQKLGRVSSVSIPIKIRHESLHSFFGSHHREEAELLQPLRKWNLC